MIIDPQVKSTARQFAGASDSFPALIQSVVDAEGGLDHIVAAVNCSVSVSTVQEALEVLCRSAVHHLSDYVSVEAPQDFLNEFGATWAPVGAENDPQGLNRNWIGNVYRLWMGKPQ